MTDTPSLAVLVGTGERAQDLTGELAERIKALVYEYSGRMTLPAAIGVLHVVASELLEEAD